MIRTIILFLFSTVLSLSSHSQSTEVSRILKTPRTKVEKINPVSDERTILINSDFSENTVANASIKINGSIESVYYFYTSYAQSASFDQKKLDAQRIDKLGRMYPEVLTNRFIEWELVEQTECKSPEEGKNYFHGFALVFRPDPSEASRKEEITRLKSFFENPEAGFNSPESNKIALEVDSKSSKSYEAVSAINGMNSPANHPDGNYALFQYFRENIEGGGEMGKNRDDIWVKFSIDVDEEGKLGTPKFKEEYPEYIEQKVIQLFKEMPDWTPEFKNGEPVSSSVNLDLRMSFSPIVRGMYNRDGKKPDFNQSEVNEFNKQVIEEAEGGDPDLINKAERSSVYKGMGEVIPSEKIAIVMDVTSSMTEHIASMVWWMTNNSDSSNVVHYTFFNDGDNMNDRAKKIGKTGGLYHGDTLYYISAKIIEAMMRGNGGDLEENDFEAVLEAQNKIPSTDAILLIADNFSDVRDESLRFKITKKVHVLVSGEVKAVRECYLDLAKQTGGDIIVNGKRITLENMRSGGQITIAESRYRFDGKRFHLL